jgi:thiol:disulfide interchange protein DsbC
MPRSTTILALIASAALLSGAAAFGQEAVIRKTLAERLPQLPKIDEVSRTPVAGIFEVRYGGTEILYSDEKGEHIFVDGALVETKTRTSLTEARLDKLTAIEFDKLPFKDAMPIKQGKGTRRMAVFVDPNCGYCKRFERDLASLKDVTIHTFLIPILGPESQLLSRDIWCATAPGEAWRGWMIEGVAPKKAAAACDAKALERNTAFARAHRINGTPAVFFADGTRKAGAIPLEQVERLLAAAAGKK